jgi:hypothetical protein
LRVKGSSEKIGSPPLEILPANSEIVPVGAIEVQSALRMPCLAMPRAHRGRAR